MALSQSKRKQPKREDKVVKEVSKTAGKVFDDKTLMVLVHFINNRTLEGIDYPVSQGKEAIVFKARRYGGKEDAAVKVFKYETASFKKNIEYVEGDPRFPVVRKQRRAFVQLWARKEFANLKTCFKAGVRVPEPIAFKENVVVMEFLGEGGIASALLVDVVLENPEQTFKLIMQDVRKMHQAGIVHADLSEFNIIIHRGFPFLIDFGQGVSLQHSKAMEYLRKDVHNICKYFSKMGVEADEEKEFEKIMKD